MLWYFMQITSSGDYFLNIPSCGVLGRLCFRFVSFPDIYIYMCICFSSFQGGILRQFLRICSIWVRWIMVLSCFHFTHCSLETPKRVVGKLCRPRSDAAEGGIWSGFPLFANSSTIFSLGISKSHSLTYLKSKLESSNIKYRWVNSVYNGLMPFNSWAATSTTMRRPIWIFTGRTCPKVHFLTFRLILSVAFRWMCCVISFLFFLFCIFKFIYLLI